VSWNGFEEKLVVDVCFEKMAFGRETAGTRLLGPIETICHLTWQTSPERVPLGRKLRENSIPHTRWW